MASDHEIKDFIKYFGDALPNPEHQPKAFEYYVRFWQYLKSRNPSERIVRK